MVVKKLNVVGITLLLALMVSPMMGVPARAENNLVQLDLKRAASDSVNLTLFTSNTYKDNVLVRKKSDNKYVILIPKVQSTGYSTPNLNGVKDLVSNIDVKTVNDTSGGYTKVTLITTKPLDIKTNTKLSTPATAEQKEYKTLIAEANAIKNTIATPQTPHKTVQPKTEITVNKANIAANKPAPSSNLKSQGQSKSSTDKTAAQKKNTDIKPNIVLQEISKEKLEKQSRKEHLSELINEIKQEQLEKQVPAVPPAVTEKIPNTPTEVKNISEMPKAETPNIKESSFARVKTLYNSVPKKTKNILFSLFGLLLLVKLSKSFTNKNKTVNTTYNPATDNLYVPKTDSNSKYSSITDNKELSWQEKYQRYLDASAKPVSRGKNKGNYTFIKTPAEPDNISKKRSELEKLLEEMPTYQNIEPEIVEDVHSEDIAIQHSIKFKAFDNQSSTLNTTNRNKAKSRFKKYEVEIPLHEQKTVELSNSPLYTNPRTLEGANLNIADVDKNRIKYKPSQYIMSSVDEYFSILDKEQVSQPSEDKQTPKFQFKETGISKQTNPISKLRDETKSSYLNNLIIKSGFNIDENRGFYMVNLEGKSALIGKVNDEITVLKKYDKIVDKPLQVRHDNANVYMVKAEGFKSLVEVGSDKMGVLIEL